MVIEIEVLETVTQLVRYHVDVASMREALQQVMDQDVEAIQRTDIEDGGGVLGIEYVHMSDPVTTWYGCRIKTDIGVACIVELSLGSLIEDLKSRLKELRESHEEVTDIRVGQTRSQSLSLSRQMVHEGQMTALLEPELQTFISGIGEDYADAVSTVIEPGGSGVGWLRE